MRNRIPEMPNHLAETSGLGIVPEGNQIVGDSQESPVCLDAFPRAHKHLSKSEMLFDFFVEDLDREAFGVEPDHLGLRHIQVAGDKETDATPRFGDEQKPQPNLRQVNPELCDSKPFLFGQTHPLVLARSLGQVTRPSLLPIENQDTVVSDSHQKGPTCFLNRIENGGTGIPGIHDDRESPGEEAKSFLEDFSCELDFAFESSRRRAFLGPIASNRPDKTPAALFENRGHRAQALDEAVGAVMNPEALDFLPLSGAGRIVQDEKGLLGRRRFRNKALILLFETPGLLDRIFQEVMKAVDPLVPELTGNLSNRSEFHKPNKAYKIDQQMFPLGSRQNLQETAQIGRNLFRELFPHGFRALLALVGIGDFGRKPFCLKELSFS